MEAKKVLEVLEKRIGSLRHRIDFGDWGSGKQPIEQRREFKDELQALSKGVYAIQSQEKAGEELPSKKPIPTVEEIVADIMDTSVVSNGIVTYAHSFNQAIDLCQPVLAKKNMEIERLSNLLWGSRCIYCGEVVGKDMKSQDIADDILRKHIEDCPKHPVSVLKKELQAKDKEIEELKTQIQTMHDNGLGDSWVEQSELEALRQRCTEIEKMSELVHKAYCQYQKDVKSKEYWTKGDYSKLSEEVKEADRYTVRAVVAHINGDKS